MRLVRTLRERAEVCLSGLFQILGFHIQDWRNIICLTFDQFILTIFLLLVVPYMPMLPRIAWAVIERRHNLWKLIRINWVLYCPLEWGVISRFLRHKLDWLAPALIVLRIRGALPRSDLNRRLCSFSSGRIYVQTGQFASLLLCLFLF